MVLAQRFWVHCRLTNIGNTTISIDDIALDYWLNGPAETTASVDQFRLVCSDTTLGILCSSALWLLVQLGAMLYYTTYDSRL